MLPHDYGKRGTVLLTVAVITASLTLKLRFDYVSQLSRSMSTIWPHLASRLWDKGRELRTGRLERRRWIRATADIEPGRHRRTELHGLSGPARRPQLAGPDLDPRPAQEGEDLWTMVIAAWLRRLYQIQCVIAA